MRPWQRAHSSANSEVDANQLGKRASFSTKAKEFVPRSQREQKDAKDNETDLGDECEVETKQLPWRAKESIQPNRSQDSNNIDSQDFHRSVSLASTDLSPTSEDDDPLGEVSDEQELEPEVVVVEQVDDAQDNLELKVSSSSWAGVQRSRRNSAMSEEPGDEDIVRKMKSILNKLTIEKFPELSMQLVRCVKTSVHLELLIHEIFEKATTQHHFVDMYVDLCVVLHAHFSENPIDDDSNKSLKKILLGACQTSFERYLTMLGNMTALQGDERTAAEQSYKRQMIGNIKLVGGLFVRKMLASRILFSIASELLNIANPEALETLAALLHVVGPTFDHPDYKHRNSLVGIFDRIRTLAKDANLTVRIRCLLRDVLELRAAGWQDSKPKKLESPSTLEKVAQEFCKEKNYGWDREWRRTFIHSRPDREYDTSSFSGSEWSRNSNQGGKTKLRDVLHRAQEFRPGPDPTASSEGCISEQAETQPGGEEVETCDREVHIDQQETSEDDCELEARKDGAYDKARCNKLIVQAFLTLIKTRDVQQAVSQIIALKVPEILQAEQLCDLLSFVVESGAEVVRTVGFELIVAMYLKCCWSQESLVEGFNSFLSRCKDPKVADVPDLEQVLCTQMVLAFSPLFDRGLLPASALLQVLEIRKTILSVPDDANEIVATHEHSTQEAPVAPVELASPQSGSVEQDSKAFQQDVTPEHSHMNMPLATQKEYWPREYDQSQKVAKQQRWKRKSLIDIAAEAQQYERQMEEAWWASAYTMPPVFYYAEPQYSEPHYSQEAHYWVA